MIGQKKILERLNELAETGNFPKFILFQGGRGWGKKQLAKEVAKILNTDLVMFDNKVDDLRECIKLAYEQTSPILYVLTGGDTMSVAAKNSILKLIEEPPKNAYIIMLVKNEETIISTIKSRAYFLRMDSYSQEELKQYLATKDHSFTEDEINKVLQVCCCPGDIEILLLPESKELLELVDKLIENIDKVTLSNLLKLSKKFKLNDNSEGMDLELFLGCLQYTLYQHYLQKRKDKYYYSYREAIYARGALRSNTTNKLYTIDLLLTEMWKIWNCGN